MSIKYHIQLQPLSQVKELRTLVENRRAYTLNNCELNVFETYRKSHLVPLRFDDMVITNMLRGKKVMHLFGKGGFDYLPGETVVVPPTVRMEIDFPEASSDNPTQCTALAIGRSQIIDTVTYLNEHYPCELGETLWNFSFENYHFYNSDVVATLMNKLLAISTSNDVHKDVLVDLTLKELLIRIMQLQNTLTVRTPSTENTSNRIGSVVAYIRENITEKLSVESLSRAVHMSKPSFHRAFKNELGVSPMEYVIRERINHAKRYLASTGSIKEACFASGFNNLNYFSRIFKKHEGVTPGAYQLIASD